MAESTVVISRDGEDLANRAARFICDAAKEAVAASGRFTIALSGGSTPEKTYARLRQPIDGAGIAWDKCFVFFGDERFVPLEDPRSNLGMARRALLDSVPIPTANVIPVRTELATAEAAAKDYAETISRFFGVSLAGKPPRLDLILLGLGDDGHTASLFPGMPTLKEKSQWVAWSPAGTLPPPVDRITFTFPLLNAGKKVAFLVSGEKKAAIVQQIIETHPSAEQYPSAGVKPDEGSVVWLLDEGSAGKLSRKR